MRTADSCGVPRMRKGLSGDQGLGYARVGVINKSDDIGLKKDRCQTKPVMKRISEKPVDSSRVSRFWLTIGLAAMVVCHG